MPSTTSSLQRETRPSPPGGADRSNRGQQSTGSDARAERARQRGGRAAECTSGASGEHGCLAGRGSRSRPGSRGGTAGAKSNWSVRRISCYGSLRTRARSEDSTEVTRIWCRHGWHRVCRLTKLEIKKILRGRVFPKFHMVYGGQQNSKRQLRAFVLRSVQKTDGSKKHQKRGWKFNSRARSRCNYNLQFRIGYNS